MGLIQELQNTEEKSYSSPLRGERLKEQIENLFTEKNVELAGKMTHEGEFTAYDQSVVIGWNMPQLRRKSAYLSGKIIETDAGSIVKIKAYPNSVLPLFAILAVMSGLVISFTTLFTTEQAAFLPIFGLLLILVGMIYYPLSTWFRNRLKNKVVGYLELNLVG